MLILCASFYLRSESPQWITILKWQDKSYYLNGIDCGKGNQGAREVIKYLSTLSQGSCLIVIANNKKGFFDTNDTSLGERYYALTSIFNPQRKILVETIKEEELNFTVKQLLLLRWYSKTGSAKDIDASYFINGTFCGKGKNGFSHALGQIKQSKAKTTLLIMGNSYIELTKCLPPEVYPFGYEEEMKLVEILKEKDIKWLHRKRFSLRPHDTSSHKPPPLPKELDDITILKIYDKTPHSTLINDINKLLEQKNSKYHIYCTDPKVAEQMIKHLEFEHTAISDAIKIIYVYEINGDKIIINAIKG